MGVVPDDCAAVQARRSVVILYLSAWKAALEKPYMLRLGLCRSRPWVDIVDRLFAPEPQPATTSDGRTNFSMNNIEYHRNRSSRSPRQMISLSDPAPPPHRGAKQVKCTFANRPSPHRTSNTNKPLQTPILTNANPDNKPSDVRCSDISSKHAPKRLDKLSCSKGFGE
jgi:hypothetical protein